MSRIGGGGFHHLLVDSAEPSLAWQPSLLSPSLLLYILVDLGFLDKSNSATSKPYLQIIVSPLDQICAVLRRSPAGIAPPPSPSRRRTAGELFFPFAPSCWIKKAEIVIELHVC